LVYWFIVETDVNEHSGLWIFAVFDVGYVDVEETNVGGRLERQGLVWAHAERVLDGHALVEYSAQTLQTFD
jgi:hypothetical protein